METPNLSDMEFAHIHSLEEGDIGDDFSITDDTFSSNADLEAGFSSSENELLGDIFEVA